MNRSTFRTLVVEDNPGDVGLLEEYFLESDHTWDLTVTGGLAEALEKAEAPDFDVVLLDLGLPDSRGLATLDRFLDGGPDLPVVVLTGASDRELAWEAVERGAHDFLPKEDLTPRLLERSLRYAVEHGRIQEELRQEKERFETVLDLSVMGIYMLDEDGRYAYANQRCGEIFGLRPRELVGRRATEFAVEDQRERAGRLIAERIRGERDSARYSLRIRREDGEVVDLDVHGRRVKIGGDPMILGAVRDVSAQNELEEELKRSRKMEAVGRLAGGVAHDFNNLLTTVAGTCGLLREEIDDDSRLAELVGDIHHAADRATDLTRQLLIFSRRDTVRTRLVDLHDIVRELESILQKLLGEAVDLSTGLHADAAHVEADPGRLEQMVMNLAINAGDAMKDGGSVWIETTNSSDRAARWDPSVVLDEEGAPSLYLRVADSGEGIPSDILPEIFDPFFTTKGPQEGTGLGLSTVHGIVTEAGGAVSAGNGPLGGAQFTIRLPASVPDSEADESTDPLDAADPSGGTILVVEDDDSVRTVVRRMLELDGHRVIEVADPEKAPRRFLDAGSVDLVLSDVVMPGLHGPAMMERIRTLDPEVPVLFMSGYSEEEAVERVGRLESRILSKPFEPAELHRAVVEELDERARPT